MFVEDGEGKIGHSTLRVYDPDSELGKLAKDGSAVVKVRFSARPTIAEFSYREYKVSKQSREPLKIGKNQHEVYLRLETTIPTNPVESV